MFYWFRLQHHRYMWFAMIHFKYKTVTKDIGFQIRQDFVYFYFDVLYAPPF